MTDDSFEIRELVSVITNKRIVFRYKRVKSLCCLFDRLPLEAPCHVTQSTSMSRHSTWVFFTVLATCFGVLLKPASSQLITKYRNVSVVTVPYISNTRLRFIMFCPVDGASKN
jgi:hypothetical protein